MRIELILTPLTPNCGPGRNRTAVQQLILGHAKILVVNVLMISQNIRFKAIYSHSNAFSNTSWVANSFWYHRRLERLYWNLKQRWYDCLNTDFKFWNRSYLHSWNHCALDLNFQLLPVGSRLSTIYDFDQMTAYYYTVQTVLLSHSIDSRF